jgi:fermentation-respiration switch protein FrsA (DUF1100 family)
MDNKKIILASGIAAAAVGAAAGTMCAATWLLVKTALDRQEPKLMKKAGGYISGTLIDPTITERIAEAEKRLAGSGTVPVELRAHDGVMLAGHWAPCENARRVVVAMHGWRSSWCRDFGLIADFLRESGCSVLYAEQRGQNNSGGDYIGFGLTERYDCLDWVNWVNGQTGAGLPVYLCGISMGATTVLMAAGLPLPENVRGIISDCAFTSPEAIWKHIANDNLHISYRLRKSQIDSMYIKRLQTDPEGYSTLSALAQTKTPVLFIHGTDDHFVPIRMTYDNYKACVSPKKLLVVPGADHGMSYLVDRDEYEKTVREFWAAHDHTAADASLQH